MNTKVSSVPQESIVLTILLSFILLFAMFIVAQTASAEVLEDKYGGGVVIGDGKNGRVWKQWKQRIAERSIATVHIKLRRQSGGNDTYVNLRFGSGAALENGKRAQFTDNNLKTVSWNVGGQLPQGKELVLNAYNGEVYVDLVKVRYVDLGKPTLVKPPKPRTLPPVIIEDNGDQSGNLDEAAAIKRCRRARVRRPRIDIGKLKATGGLFSGKYKAKGSIYGNCIEEAGYFENGRLKEEIEFPLDDRFQRREFSVKVRSGRRGEIKAYTTDGREDVIDIDQELKDK